MALSLSCQEISAVPIPAGALEPTTVPTFVPNGHGATSSTNRDLSQRTWMLALLSGTPELLVGAELRDVWHDA